MPCIHCARRDFVVGTGVASTSSRCEQTAPVQRVAQTGGSQEQFRRQLKRSPFASTRAVRQCQPVPQRKLRQVSQPGQRQQTQGWTDTQALQTQASQRFARCMLQGFAAAAVLSLLAPGPSYSAETLPIGLLKSWVVSFCLFWHSCCCYFAIWHHNSVGLQEQVESLGPVVGPLIFILTMASAEMIPLFPTQPLSLASGLLFGPVQGTVCVICGTGLAAITAFSVSRGVGRKLAQRVVSDELKSESSEQSVVVESKFQGIQDAIDQGSFAQQSIAVAMLRLTPVIPFSASNYLLGMTPLELPAFMTGTVAGMSVWGLVYASLGGASRSLLKSGMDLEELIGGSLAYSGSETEPGTSSLLKWCSSDLASKASVYTEDAIAVAALAGFVAAAYYGIKLLREQRDKQVAEAEALLQQEQELNKSPVKRVQRLVQRLKGNA